MLRLHSLDAQLDHDVADPSLQNDNCCVHSMIDVA